MDTSIAASPESEFCFAERSVGVGICRRSLDYQKFFEGDAFLDEPHCPMMGDASKINGLATAKQEGKEQPQVWTKENGKGRVFVSVVGRYPWTHEDRFFQVSVRLGIAWDFRRNRRVVCE